MVMHVELQATCSALGYQEGNVYHREPDCLETVKDLIRYLKKEDETCDIRRELGEAQILQKDLLPIIKQHNEDRILLETVIRLLVNLTQPAVLCFQNSIPEDKTTRHHYLDIESHLQAYKEAFADEALFAVLTKKLGDLLQLDWEHRQEEDRLLIERILIIVRNILHVPPNSSREQRTDDDVSVHDQVLWALHTSGMEDLLLYLANSDDERSFAFHVLEIITLMFREQTPQQLADTGRAKSSSQKEKEEKELELLREKERQRKKASAFKLSSRHSRFGGTFEVKNMKSISDRNVIYHRSVHNSKEISFDHNKNHKKKPKNRRPIKEDKHTRRSTLAIRMFMKEFCVQFLENCYNPLMYAVKDALARSKAQENDETYYLWAMRFFMEFSRKYQFRVDIISETMSMPTFHYIQVQMIHYQEMIMTDKKQALIWSRRLHLALQAYYELLQNMCHMDRSGDKQLRESAKVLKGNVFYMMEYRDIFLGLLKQFNETRQSRVYLRDLLEATHLYLKMLENQSKASGHMMVQRKKIRKRKKVAKKTVEEAAEPQFTEQELEDQWDEVSSELSAIFQGRGQIPDDVTPFDAASEVDVDQQRVDAMLKIQDALREEKAGEAVAMFRAAREVWPERDEFGSANISPEEEFMALREILYANLPRPAAATSQLEEEQEDEDDEVEQEEMAGVVDVGEVEFNFKDFVRKFANPNMLRPYVVLLGDYHKNSIYTNHCAVKMLHRVAYDCGVVGLLFQASLFRVFQKVLNDPGNKAQAYKELSTFAIHIMRKFFEVTVNNSKVFVELFFWKSTRDAFEICEGYGTYKESQSKTKQLWTEEEEMELMRLCEQYRDSMPSGMDMADYITTNLIDQTKTRRQVIKKLKLMEIMEVHELNPNKKSRPAKEWAEEEEEQLRTLVEEFRDSQDPVGNIMLSLTVKRPKNRVIEKILELGLVEDKKELYKKRSRKSGGRKKKGAEEEMDFLDEREDGEDELPVEESSEEGPSSSDDENDESSGDEESEAPRFIIKIKKSAKALREEGLSEQIKWLQRLLRRTADDKDEEDEDDNVAIPIVPLSEDQMDAMEKKNFQMLLKKIGLKPPANEQERYWRIPPKLTAADLRCRADALSENTESKKPPSGRAQMLQQMAEMKKMEKKEGKKRRTARKLATEDVLKSIENGEENKSTKKKKSPKKSRKIKILDDSSSDDDEDRLVIDENGPHSGSEVNKGEASTSGSDNEIPLRKLTNEGSAARKPLINDDDSSDDEMLVTTATHKSSLVMVKDSESSDDDNESFLPLKLTPAKQIPAKKAKETLKTKASIIDDDDDDSDVPLNAASAKTTSSKKTKVSSQNTDDESDEPLSSVTKVKASKTSATITSDDDDDDDIPLSSAVSKKPSSAAKKLIDDDSDEDDIPLSAGNTSVTSTQKRSRVIESDSDDDVTKRSPPSKQARLEKSDTASSKISSNVTASFPATVMTQPPSDSDSDVDDHIPIRRGVKRAAIESDSD